MLAVAAGVVTDASSNARACVDHGSVRKAPKRFHFMNKLCRLLRAAWALLITRSGICCSAPCAVSHRSSRVPAPLLYSGSVVAGQRLRCSFSWSVWCRPQLMHLGRSNEQENCISAGGAMVGVAGDIRIWVGRGQIESVLVAGAA